MPRSKEYIDERNKKGEFEFDKIFVKHIVNAIQKISPDIAAIIYEELKDDCFLDALAGKEYYFLQSPIKQRQH